MHTPNFVPGTIKSYKSFKITKHNADIVWNIINILNGSETGAFHIPVDFSLNYSVYLILGFQTTLKLSTSKELNKSGLE